MRKKILDAYLENESSALKRLMVEANISTEQRQMISQNAAALVQSIRDNSDPSIMEVFLAEYGLSTDEGVALMCLAEGLLRVPDDETIDALIEDKIAASSWGEHLGKSTSSLVNASTWALMITGKVLNDDQEPGIINTLHGAIKRLGEPVIRKAVETAMKELGAQFVLGRDISEAMKNASKYEKQGYTYSYDMLGEAARTEADAKRYHLAYADAIGSLAKACEASDIRDNPGISVKLSALHPRYEEGQRERVLQELVPRTRSLALLAKSAGMGFNIDAEEADRLDLSLDVIEGILADPSLKGWDGFGIVVQAYGQRAGLVIDHLYEMAVRLDRKIMVRLVKGAYWDTEIKLAQTKGINGFPVFTQKSSTDVSYVCNAKKLLGYTDRIYPQFATHNAHTVSAVLALAQDKTEFEFQRLHGMGESLHETVLKDNQTRCRIYAPVGAHRDLLAYLVRRLLENGANSSFVNQIVDETVPPSEIATDPFTLIEAYINDAGNEQIDLPTDIYLPERKNAFGWDITHQNDIAIINEQRSKFTVTTFGDGKGIEIVNPCNPSDIVGHVIECDANDAKFAINNAKKWNVSAKDRAKILNKAADLYESNSAEIFAVLAREAGKTWLDAVGEIREAVDFLRYYAAQSLVHHSKKPKGLITCISPWNFPLAIFSGQISAALAAGNGVLAKPAEQTPLIARLATGLLHEAGVPKDVLQLLPGAGSVVGAALTADPRISGVCFTGSTITAQRINASIAEHLDPSTSLIAETGGLNAMIVDSTALPEQAVRDILASAFQSAGQRCSALRVLYVQEEIEETLTEMLFGAMDELRVGDPWDLATDVGPVIDRAAQIKIKAHIESARERGRVVKEISAPKDGIFIAPTVIKIDGIHELKEEIFGPVLHIATFKSTEMDAVIDAVNATGYGLTFGLHSRIDDRVEHVSKRIEVGNLYINRNQIGAIVGSQPFGGEGLSGTGPKAGGPSYIVRFYEDETIYDNVVAAEEIPLKAVQTALQSAEKPDSAYLSVIDLPGPTGESNRLTTMPRGTVLCLGPTAENAIEQVKLARSAGCAALGIAPDLPVEFGLSGRISIKDLESLAEFELAVLWADAATARPYKMALASRKGAIVPLITAKDFSAYCTHERHLCVDTTAAGGNASLLASS